MWELDCKESWRLKNWCFWTVCCWRLLRAPWTARRSNQLILSEYNLNIHGKDWCWSWNSNILATWYEEVSRWKRPWCWTRLNVGREEEASGWNGWILSRTWWTQTWVWASSGSWCYRETCCAAVHGITKIRTWLCNWTELCLFPGVIYIDHLFLLRC